MKKIILLYCLGLLFITLTALAEAREEPVQIALDEAYPPYSLGVRPVRGLYVELIATVFAKAGIKVNIEGYPWKRALCLAEKGEIAVGGVFKNAKRLKIYDYSDPIYQEKLVIFVKKGKRFSFYKLSDLAGKTIGMNLGWSYGEKLDQARRSGLFTVQEARNNQANFFKLLTDRIQCMITDESAALPVIQQENLKNKIEILPHPASLNNTYLIFAKIADKKHIIRQFNEALSAIKKDGSYSEIVRRFIINKKQDNN